MTTVTTVTTITMSYSPLLQTHYHILPYPKNKTSTKHNTYNDYGDHSYHNHHEPMPLAKKWRRPPSDLDDHSVHNGRLVCPWCSRNPVWPQWSWWPQHPLWQQWLWCQWLPLKISAHDDHMMPMIPIINMVPLMPKMTEIPSVTTVQQPSQRPGCPRWLWCR